MAFSSRDSRFHAFYSRSNTILQPTTQLDPWDDGCLDDERSILSHRSIEETPRDKLQSSPRSSKLYEAYFKAFTPLPVAPISLAKGPCVGSGNLEERTDQLQMNNFLDIDQQLKKWLDADTLRQTEQFLAASQASPDTDVYRTPSIGSSIDWSHSRSTSLTSFNNMMQINPQYRSLLMNEALSTTTLPHSQSVDEANTTPITEIFGARKFASPESRPFDPSGYISSPSQQRHGDAYMGHTGSSSNQVNDLPEHLNTCVWVNNAPADVDYKELLGSIRQCGRIFSAHINRPQGKYLTSAAKIAFCTRAGAEAFLAQARSEQGVSIRDNRLSVRWNRNKYRANDNAAESRVLLISGPAKFVNFETLQDYFSKLFYFQLIEAREVAVAQSAGGETASMVWEFGSILAQAHSARQAIEREPLLKHVVTVQHLPDPCE